MKYVHTALTGALLVSLVMVSVLPAGAGHRGDPRTKNIHPLGHDVSPASLIFGPTDIHTDIAFWGKLAYQGNWNGFRILDISSPGNPKLISFTRCEGNQGDVSVWGNILVRSWNSPAPEGVECDGQEVAPGFEGVHIFDVSNPAHPTLITEVATECGSHTHTLVPDLTNKRVIVYSNASGGCAFIDIIEVPLRDPASASLLRTEPLVGASGCHDMGVILGDAKLAACASRAAANVFDMSNLEDPEFLYSISEPGIGDGTQGGGSWHSAAFSWDGDVIILGWEPGGGGAPRCQETGADLGDGLTQTDAMKTLFFYDSANGNKIGEWTLPRPQSDLENCTIHNYNVVPLRRGRDVLVHGSYQSGTSVVDFSDPGNPVELGYSDPPPLEPLDIGGAWSSYWYNNFIYETNITEGLNIFRFSGRETAGALRLRHLNPQTQEFTIDNW